MKKGRIINLLLLAAIALVLFTPLGFHLKVLVNRIISFNPVPVEEREQQVLESYDWKLQDLQGRSSNLVEAEGKVILINFWASWCPPCVAEMPDLDNLYADYKKDVSFYFVARDQKVKVNAFLDKHGYNLPVYYESGFTPDQLYSGALPTTFIIDKKGHIVVAKTGSASWNSPATRKLLDDLIQE